MMFSRTILMEVLQRSKDPVNKCAYSINSWSHDVLGSSCADSYQIILLLPFSSCIFFFNLTNLITLS